MIPMVLIKCHWLVLLSVGLTITHCLVQIMEVRPVDGLVKCMISVYTEPSFHRWYNFRNEFNAAAIG